MTHPVGTTISVYQVLLLSYKSVCTENERLARLLSNDSTSAVFIYDFQEVIKYV